MFIFLFWGKEKPFSVIVSLDSSKRWQLILSELLITLLVLVPPPYYLYIWNKSRLWALGTSVWKSGNLDQNRFKHQIFLSAELDLKPWVVHVVGSRYKGFHSNHLVLFSTSFRACCKSSTKALSDKEWTASLEETYLCWECGGRTQFCIFLNVFFFT